ncbi:unnamed protein product [Darwinula stevensoni]|uniref:Uncharacterized protein n=1 Tax=Darwinula stevensoni TaxID=69355 RepID=A0A7R9A2K9_9CRUS|nr:unnamed protein product [Darwinula stevensoni]CAG0879728.1 unnamed protein product [Darwinula stevensoni]
MSAPFRVIFVLAFAFASSLCPHASALPSPTDCSPARQYFRRRNVTETLGTGPGLCAGDIGCCTGFTSADMTRAGIADLQDGIRDTSAALRHLFTSTSVDIHETFLRELNVSEEYTLKFFHMHYADIFSEVKGDVVELFRSLRERFAEGEAIGDEVQGIGDTVQEFFDRLFPYVYHQIVEPKAEAFTEEYRECLRRHRRELNPFGRVPGDIAASVHRSFKALRAVNGALKTGEEVLQALVDGAERIGIESCGMALGRLRPCSFCSPSSRSSSSPPSPCPGFCMNVLRGCLAPWSELDLPWNEFLDSLAIVLGSGKGRTRGRPHVQIPIQDVDLKISEGIILAYENDAALEKQVKKACGSAERSTTHFRTDEDLGKSALLTNTRRSLALPAPKEDGEEEEEEEDFRTVLLRSKGFFANLADAVCSRDAFSAHKEVHCWNGSAVGEYSRRIAGIGQSGQMSNPEVLAPAAPDHQVLGFVERLRIYRKELVSLWPGVGHGYGSLVASEEEEGSGAGEEGSGAVHPHSQPPHLDLDYEVWGGAEGSGEGSGGGIHPPPHPRPPTHHPASEAPPDIGFGEEDEDVVVKTSGSSVVVFGSFLTLLPCLCALFAAST